MRVGHTAHTVRQLVVKTICDVTGDDADEVLDASPMEVDPRDWEQILSRLEATFDCTLDLLTSPDHLINIRALTREIQARLGRLRRESGG
jgi:hypothetical protein